MINDIKFVKKIKLHWTLVPFPNLVISRCMGSTSGSEDPESWKWQVGNASSDMSGCSWLCHKQLLCLTDYLISPIYAREITNCIYAKLFIYLFIYDVCTLRSQESTMSLWFGCLRLLVCLAHTSVLYRVHCRGQTISSHSG